MRRKGGLKLGTFYEKALGAKCSFHAMADDGKRVAHANLEMFGSGVMLHDEFPSLVATSYRRRPAAAPA